MLTDRERNIASFILSKISSDNRVFYYNMSDDFIYMEYGTRNYMKYEQFYYKDYLDEIRLKKIQKLKTNG